MRLHIKKIPVVTIVVAIIFAVGLLLFIGAYSKKGALSQINILGGRETTIESQNIDTDNDGLKDWEEDLYKTDSLNPDTDNDGYLDGEEINSGHNPLVKGPDDNQVFYPLPVGDKYNITDKLLGDFDAIAKSYIIQKDEYLKDHPKITNPEQYLAQTAQSTLNEMFKRAMLYNEKDWLEGATAILQQIPELFSIGVSDNNIVITEDNSPEIIKIYTETLMSYLNSKDFFLKQGNLVLLKEVLSKNEFSSLDAIIKSNNTEIENLVATPVPSSWKEVHKKMLKIAITMRNIFVSVRGFETDPIKTLIALDEVKNVSSLWDELTNEIINLNKTQNLNLSL